MVLRWERLVGRLAAAAAQRKTLLLLQWLQLHLAFTEGCSSRATWLSQKVGGDGGACGDACVYVVQRSSIPTHGRWVVLMGKMGVGGCRQAARCDT